MPIADLAKLELAKKHRLYHKICRDCGVRNDFRATRCRKCHGRNLRHKNREIGTGL
jgi:large subunit ribosomal protein L40e